MLKIKTINLKGAIAEAAGDAEKAARKVVNEFFTDVVSRSPATTGKFKANWYVGRDSIPAESDESARDMTGAVSLQRINAQTATPIKGAYRIYLVNNLPYALPLEFGSSGKAPRGMARISLMEIVRKYGGR